MCWQHTVPNTYIKNLTSHLHAIVRTHHFDFDFRCWPISAVMLKTIHWSWIWSCLRSKNNVLLWLVSMVSSVSLMLNGQVVVSVGGGNDTSASNSVLLPVSKGDRVWLQLVRGRLIEMVIDKGWESSQVFSGPELSLLKNHNRLWVNGDGSVGWVVASDIRSRWFESHRLLWTWTERISCSGRVAYSWYSVLKIVPRDGNNASLILG